MFILVKLDLPTATSLLERFQHSQTGATFSSDERYRYLLWRRWSSSQLALFIGLNPSTADAANDDPTIRRITGFSRSLGFGGFLIVNLFAFRATKPIDLFASSDPIGPENDA